MSEPVVTIIPSEGGAVSIFKYSNGYQYSMYTENIEPLRKALNARHKEQKAAKKAERRFYARQSLTGEFWIVQDRTEGHVTRASLPHTTNAKADAKAFATMLNKQARKEASQ